MTVVTVNSLLPLPTYSEVAASDTHSNTSSILLLPTQASQGILLDVISDNQTLLPPVSNISVETIHWHFTATQTVLLPAENLSGKALVSVLEARILTAPTQASQVTPVPKGVASQVLSLPTQTATVFVNVIARLATAAQTVLLPTENIAGGILVVALEARILILPTQASQITPVDEITDNQFLLPPVQTTNVFVNVTYRVGTAVQTISLPFEDTIGTPIVACLANQPLLLPGESSAGIATIRAASVNQVLFSPAQSIVGVASISGFADQTISPVTQDTLNVAAPTGRATQILLSPVHATVIRVHIVDSSSVFLGRVEQFAFVQHSVARVIHVSQILLPTETSVHGLTFWEQARLGSKLLYHEATGLERAMADADGERLIGMDAELITNTWDPFSCPAPLLPYLAWAMGVTFWNDQWSEMTKRNWIGAQWQFKGYRGTAAAISMGVGYAGRDVSPFGYRVKKITTRPQQLFPSRSLSNEMREVWLNSLPQVRVYYYQQTGIAPVSKWFCGMGWLGTANWPGNMVIIPSYVKKRLGRKATWNVDNIDTDVGITDFGNYFRLQFQGKAGVGLFTDTVWAPEQATKKFIIPSSAWRRLVTVAPQTNAPYQVAVGPSLRAVQAQPEVVALPGNRGYGMYCGSNYLHDAAGTFTAPPASAPDQLPTRDRVPFFPSFLIPSTAKNRLYQRYSVFDPNNLPARTSPSTWFSGIGRLSFPPFTAEVDVRMPSRDCPVKFRIGNIMRARPSFAMPHDNRPIEYVASSVNSGRRLVDKVLLRTKPTPSFVAGAPFIADIDSFVVGQAKVSD
jgi:phage tail P2-like protein